jgi:shikimate kinase
MDGASNKFGAEKKRTIALVGMMGVGKTSIGKRLSARLSIPFLDADHEIEHAAGMTIAEIFARFGEKEFRDGERRVISRLIDGKPKVLATGGGAFMNEATRTLLLAEATTVWINAEIATLVDRVGRRDNRPLLAGRNPKEVLAELVAVRNPIYALAPIHVKSESAPHDHTVEQILKALKEQAQP